MESCGTYADGVIAICYFSVGASLFYLWTKRPDIAESWITLFFTPVFTLCGAGHAAHFLSIWFPAMIPLSHTIMYVQAIVAIPALIALFHVVRRVIGAISRVQYDEALQELHVKEAYNDELERTIKELRKRLEANL